MKTIYKNIGIQYKGYWTLVRMVMESKDSEKNTWHVHTTRIAPKQWTESTSSHGEFATQRLSWNLKLSKSTLHTNTKITYIFKLWTKPNWWIQPLGPVGTLDHRWKKAGKLQLVCKVRAESRLGLALMLWSHITEHHFGSRQGNRGQHTIHVHHNILTISYMLEGQEREKRCHVQPNTLVNGIQQSRTEIHIIMHFLWNSEKINTIWNKITTLNPRETLRTRERKRIKRKYKKT